LAPEANGTLGMSCCSASLSFSNIRGFFFWCIK
jgi:hypothetical protein